MIQSVNLVNNEADINVPITSEMAPSARIIVYGIRPDNKEIVVNLVVFKVSGLFRNNVTLWVQVGKNSVYFFISIEGLNQCGSSNCTAK